MQVFETELSGVLLLEPKRFGDDRGWFSESWNAQVMAGLGIETDWVQDNHSYSADAGTLRGLHYQTPPHAQDKLVRCTRGAIYDVAVDFRKGSPTFLHWIARELTAENGHQLLVPRGFLHGFQTLVPDCEVQYKCSDFYAPDCDAAVRWDDPAIAIDWPGSGEPVLSGKDTAAPLSGDVKSPFEWDQKQ
ncbi:dTDP-4-dehydrorhamnose 3,5-epimerase [Pontixanthobacter aquaemixtae]|uniref:dTDP-4-dehydrorhamnose 3,5-epimerase n=1 Tax=Pontixanthobacter aquaemixtae TaxID=1958940 RepID=A0A844ZVZ5_9SPHN|nr:dTDP-4-dehydrorhamnose 3,5-epimerase [Pontixanthobacter aquaemixtae]MXO91350.1 dTDP-4-dehydrorhamnose 3,5-epimerase [Pontixanthobacter aquaemixtae]